MASSGTSSTSNSEDLELIRQNDASPKFNRSYDRWSPTEEGATLVFRDLNIHAADGNKHKAIISGVTGAVKPGSLVALMGSSGAGKSTLMSALAYQSQNMHGVTIEGEILVNGRPVGPYMRIISAYMHQEDLFVASQTVWEHMQFAARLKLDRRMPKEARDEICLSLLKRLGLTHALHTTIGGIGEAKSLSGGEKKRLAFATELLTDPQILFCDEPTTGLDSFSARKLVAMMNEMAGKGKTVVCTIHQPSSQIFAMFSQIILLAEGRIAYMGSTVYATEFLSSLGYTCPKNYNPADFLVKTLGITPGAEDNCRQTARAICNRFAVSDYAKEVDVLVQYECHMGSTIIEDQQHQDRYQQNGNNGLQNELQLKRWKLEEKYLRGNFKEVFWWTKFLWLTRRYFRDILRNPSVQLMRMVQKMAIAIMVGLCYFGTNPLTQNGIQSLQGALVTIVCENTFPAMYSVLAEFPNNIPLFLREYKAGMYSPTMFYAAKTMAMLPGIIIEAFLFVVIIYFLTGLRHLVDSFLLTAVAAILVMNVSCACGIFFSNMFETVNNAMLCLVPFDYILMITSGFFVNLSSLGKHISWTKYLSWLMYGMESLTIVQWSGVNNITCENDNPKVPCLRTGDEVLKEYSFDEKHLGPDLFSMLAMCICFHVFAFIALLKKIRNK